MTSYNKNFTKHQLRDLLEKLDFFADYYKFDTYRKIAYMKAVANINSLEVVSLNKIKSVVGERIFEKIKEWYITGKIEQMEQMMKIKEIPVILGYNMKMIYSKYNLYGLSIDKIVEFLNTKNPNNLQKIGLKYVKDLNIKIPRREVELIGNKVSAVLNIKIELMGSYRRGNLMSGDVDILIVGKANIIAPIEDQPWFITWISKGSQKSSFLCKVLKYVRKVDIFFCNPNNYITFVLYLTGSREHNMMLRAVAKKYGMKLNAEGLWKGENKISLKNERDVYKRIGIEYVEPEKR